METEELAALNWSYFEEDAAREIRKAYRETRITSAGGMSIEAMFAGDYAKEIAARDAVIAVLKHHGYAIVPQAQDEESSQ